MPERCPGAVALLTGKRRMGALEQKIGQGVVDSGRTELVDVGVAAEVLGMAAPALSGLGILHPPVVAGGAANVRRDVLVAVEAEDRLALAMGAVMTGAALRFDLFVSLAERTRHDQLLDVRRLPEGREQQENQRENPCPRHLGVPSGISTRELKSRARCRRRSASETAACAAHARQKRAFDRSGARPPPV